MNPETEIITIISIFVWIGVGIFLSYKHRKSPGAIKILVFVLCTKGFVLFYIPYYIYILIKNFKKGMKEENIEQQKKLNGKDH